MRGTWTSSPSWWPLIKRVLDDLDINHIRVLLNAFRDFDSMEECGWATVNLKEFLPLLDASDRVPASTTAVRLPQDHNERRAFFFLNCLVLIEEFILDR